jgi:hypothetical protein
VGRSTVLLSPKRLGEQAGIFAAPLGVAALVRAGRCAALRRRGCDGPFPRSYRGESAELLILARVGVAKRV